MMNYGINWEAIVAISVVLLIIGSIPVLLILFGLHHFNRKQPKMGLGQTGLGVATGIALLWGVLVYVDSISPKHSGVLAEGLSPGGFEYCVVQSYTGELPGPFQVSFYIRSVDGVWRWHYLEHEDLAWHSTQVEFDGDSAIVFRNEKLFRVIPIATESVNRASIPADSLGEYYPASMSVADLFTDHEQQFR